MKTFETNRLVPGNRVFPTKISIGSNKLTIIKRGIFSEDEKVIPFSKIVSVKLHTPLLNFSHIEIVTEGEVVKIEGLTKSEAKEIRDLIVI
jgi:membrane protein YdbS with pleckstrin-like domain